MPIHFLSSCGGNLMAVIVEVYAQLYFLIETWQRFEIMEVAKIIQANKVENKANIAHTYN